MIEQYFAPLTHTNEVLCLRVVRRWDEEEANHHIQLELVDPDRTMTPAAREYQQCYFQEAWTTDLTRNPQVFTSHKLAVKFLRNHWKSALRSHYEDRDRTARMIKKTVTKLEQLNT